METIMNKRVTVFLTMLSVSACLIGGCATVNVNIEKPEKTAAEEPVEIICFAAASMTETMEEIKTAYQKLHPEVTITYNFDSSGTLKTQIEEGADCDLFISAAKKQMDQLDELDLVDDATRIDLLENKVTLSVPEGNPKNINSYDDMAAGLKDKSILLAMGNEDVPVGQYTQKIFEYYGLDEAALAGDSVITYGSNVKEVTSQICEACVDCGVIYQTDAFSAGLTVVDTATEEMCGQVIYPAAVLKTSKDPDAAKAFLDYLLTDESGKVFESVGFTTIK